MTCQQIREELELAFGQIVLSAELRAHLESCVECRAYAEELGALHSSLGDDAPFVPDLVERNKLAWAVEDALNGQAVAKRGWTSRLRYVAAAAVVVLAVAIGYNQYRTNPVAEKPVSPDSAQIASVDSNARPGSDAALSDTEIEQMLYDYSTLDKDAATTVLQNLTDEEMQYLEKNFDVGELL